MKRKDYIIEGWSEYKLLDSGQSRKLESFGGVILDRPEPQALWDKKNPTIWQNADAHFVWADKGERWKISKNTSETWDIKWNDLTVGLSFGGFKHIGIFPEHSVQWGKIIELGKKHKNLKMLNLFGYTGVASLAALTADLEVTHVDASKQTIQTFKNNLKKSNLENKKIRIIIEDVLKYVKRLIARGEKFDVIVMDPPAFGRGPKGEVWKIEESLSELMSLIPKIISKNVKLIILNGYASGYSAQTFGQVLSDTLGIEDIVYGEIGIKEKDSDRILTTGIYSMYSKD